MGYSAGIYQQAVQTLARRRAEAEMTAARRREEAEARIPALRELNAQITRAGLDAVKAIGMKEDADSYLRALKENSLQAQAKRRALLREGGFPEDYLSTPYTCKACSDSGFVDGIRCACMDALMKSIAYSALCSDFPLDKNTFDRFNLNLYSKSLDPTLGEAPYDRMKKIFAYCKQYADEFSLKVPSLFFFGETGLGKTHLSLAIAGQVVQKGFGVIYGSAQNLIGKMEREHFKGENEGVTDSILTCDLLILDDLGAEFTSSFSVAAMYNIINTRLQSGLPTIISTNLTANELEKRYTRRITSRIFGGYKTFGFCGSDNRMALR